MTLQRTDGLRPAYDEQTEKRIVATQPGMAHFAGTGPDGVTCRECDHWHHRDRYRASGKLSGGKICDAPCKQYTRMMNGRLGPNIPPATAACKYFEDAARVPPLFRRGE